MSDLSDGRLIFTTKVDNSQAEKDLKALQRKIEKSQETISKITNEKELWSTKSGSLSADLDSAKARAAKLRKELEAVREATKDPSNPAAYLEAEMRLPELETELEQSNKEVDKLQKQWEKATEKVENYDRKIQQAEADIERYQEKQTEIQEKMYTPNQVKMSESMAKAEKTAGSFGKRIRSIAASALVFNLISKGLRSMVSYMGQALKSNSEYTAQLARLKGALLTAFQPIYTYVLPGLMSVMKVLTAIVSAVGNVLSYLFGSTLVDSAKGAKVLLAIIMVEITAI